MGKHHHVPKRHELGSEGTELQRRNELRFRLSAMGLLQWYVALRPEFSHYGIPLRRPDGGGHVERNHRSTRHAYSCRLGGNILDPVYQWLNTINGGLDEVGNFGQLSTNVALNRDVYRGTSSFNGTTGVGVGTLANRPVTCTPFVAYWATDQGFWNNKTPGVAAGQLYKCTATNTWTLWYVPYTYPNPLQQPSQISRKSLIAKL